MLTVTQALAALLREVRPFPPSTTPLDEALGLVLAEGITSSTDSPPFDKSLMDGFAVRAADVANGTATLRILEEITAGKVPTRPVGPGEATQIMTGAPLPEGADAVVRIEDATIEPETNTVHLNTRPVRPGDSIVRRGTSLKTGQQVLPAGRLLRPQELGALAEFGVAELRARRRPTVAVLATGDELVPVAATPGPGQIRNSNETMLVAQIRRAGGEPVPLGIARDNRADLRAKIEAGLRCDLLLLSGGVSAGKLDLVPSELEAAGVRQVFHKVDIKPGKPIWFGSLARLDGSTCHVFGLPGNPVSSMVCFELFARTTIRRLMGVEPAEPQSLPARLEVEHTSKGDRPTYHPARIRWTADGPTVSPVRWHGSSDLHATVDANGTALFPPGNQTYHPGDIVQVHLWD